jgi:hypothetical protein
VEDLIEDRREGVAAVGGRGRGTTNKHERTRINWKTGHQKRLAAQNWPCQPLRFHFNHNR